MIQETLNAALEYARPYIKDGKIADYIPELTKTDPNYLGACVIDVKGNKYVAGDYTQQFTIQSISKTMTFLYALNKLGHKEVFKHVGMEATGDAFNSIIRLEQNNGKPFNPMINAGAIAISALLEHNGVTFEEFLSFVRKICHRDNITINEGVYLSESLTGDRNRALAYIQKACGNIDGDVPSALDFYFRTCSISCNCEDLAYYSSLLANGGKDVITGEQILNPTHVKVVKTIMVTCGLYDGSGGFAMRVGMPGKSGVGGGIIASCEKTLGIAAFSPALDVNGNSCGAYKIMSYMSEKLGLHYFSEIERKI